MSSKNTLAGSGTHLTEGLAGLTCGIAFGITTAVVGQPFDSLKTKMQAEPRYARMSMLGTLRTVLGSEGIYGLYKGILPPLFGSTIFRSLQFGVYNYSYSHMGEMFPVTTQSISWLADMEMRVVLGGLCAGAVRSVIETPLEVVSLGFCLQ